MARLGGWLMMWILIPGFVFAFVAPTIATTLLLYSGYYSAQLAQAAIAAACFCRPSLGRAGAALAAGITVAVYRSNADAAPLVGSSIWFLMTLVNWGIHFPYSPAFTRLLFRLNMASYWEPQSACELRGAVDKMGRSRTLFMFHPHGIITAGFSVNGIFSRDFHERTLPAEHAKSGTSGRWDFEGASGGWPGTIFLLTSGLREPSHYFKLICDLTGRMESATRANIKLLMRAGRNIALLPGGFEEATAFEHGVNRVVIRERKGIIKYALEHGYSLQLIYTFGECRSYHSLFSGLKRLRMWINRHQIPAVAFFGDPLVPIFPRRDVPCLSYVAPPMQLPHIEAPTEAQVEEWHARYVAALQSHFEASKAHAGEPDALLEVW